MCTSSHQTFMSLREVWREGEGGEKRGIQKGCHIGNTHIRRRAFQGEHLNAEGLRGTARVSSTINSKCRATVGARGKEKPPVLELWRQTVTGDLCPNCFSPLIPRATRRHGKGCIFF